MTKYISYLIPLLLISLIAGKEPEAPYGLMTEFIREPQHVKVMDLRPELTWIVPHAAERQTAYQILTASSESSLRKNRGDAWDSGKIVSSASSEVEYNGPVLKANTKYFWKVRIWDINGRPSGYSEIQPFITGDPYSYSTTANRFTAIKQKPGKLVMRSEGICFADFGKDAFGTLMLDIKSEMPDTIIIHLGEKLTADNTIDRHPGGSVRYQKVILPLKTGKNEILLHLPSDSRNTGPAAVHLPDSFGVVTPFRYCEIEKRAELHGQDDITRISYSYYTDDNASFFNSSDTLLDRIWELCKYSIKATSFAGIYIDGDRERIPYEGDAYINQLGHYYTDREYSMARITNEYLIKHPTWPAEWQLHNVLLFYNDYLFTGNSESLKANYTALKYKTLNSLADEDGFISSERATDETMKELGFSNVKERIRDIVDWPPAQKDTGWKLATPDGERDGYDMRDINTVVNAFYYRNLVLMSEIARILGENDDAGYFSKEADKTYKSFNEKLFDKTKGYYVDGLNSSHSSLHANMMALDFGLVPDKYRNSVVCFIKSRGMACSVYGAQYLLEGLFNAGEADYAYSFLTSTGDRSWWNMIRSGSTITMEAWDMKYKPNSDWNHAWGAAPANIIPGYMWGIRPAEPGYSKAVIRPQLGNLKWSRIKVPTIRGSIIAEYQNKDLTKEYQITIPGNMECDFIPAGGKPISLKPGFNRIIL